MYRIAVCEDEEDMRELLCSYCEDILNKENIVHEIRTFSSAEEFECEDADSFDLLILDICLNEKSGMDMAKELRRSGSRISIIFVSAYDEYLKDGYSVQPIHFLLKPVSEEELAAAIAVDIRLNHSVSDIVIRSGAKTVVLSPDRLVYAESLDHKVLVHMRGSEHIIKTSLTELEEQCRNESICRCHNSYIVNMKYISEFTRNGVILQNGVRIPIGRKYYYNVQEKFVKYING